MKCETDVKCENWNNEITGVKNEDDSKISVKHETKSNGKESKQSQDSTDTDKNTDECSGNIYLQW